MLLSINPEHVKNIFKGTKRYEFRKVRCRTDVSRIIIYATSPVMMVVGEAEVVDIIEDEPKQIWELTCEFAGISRSFFDKYYKNKDRAVAYRLGKVKEYSTPKSLSDFGLSFAPQSFVYI